MHIAFERREKILIVSIQGELDHHYASVARIKIEEEILAAVTQKLIFNFTGLGFMDSSGIGVIIGRYKTMEKLEGTVAIFGVTPQVDKLIEISGIKKIIKVYATLEEAIRGE